MPNPKIKSFTDLLAWQEGHKLVLIIYALTKNMPKSEVYSLIDQMRRSAISVTSNIAEGFGRNSYKDRLHFFYQSQGSLTELKSQILIARDISYLSGDDYKKVADSANSAHRLLQGLMTATKKIINS